MIVYVVGFAPANDRAAVGGFDWYYEQDDASKRLAEYADRLNDDHSFTYVPLEVPNRMSGEQITRFIDNNLHLIEVSR